jgi:hypothetical protein
MDNPREEDVPGWRAWEAFFFGDFRVESEEEVFEDEGSPRHDLPHLVEGRQGQRQGEEEVLAVAREALLVLEQVRQGDRGARIRVARFGQFGRGPDARDPGEEKKAKIGVVLTEALLGEALGEVLVSFSEVPLAERVLGIGHQEGDEFIGEGMETTALEVFSVSRILGITADFVFATTAAGAGGVARGLFGHRSLRGFATLLDLEPRNGRRKVLDVSLISSICVEMAGYNDRVMKRRG